ncbi:DNA mismatch repair protein [Schnuerera sp. xch1]|uniref:MutS family DNA mismatch repair protein n=1 Tax=Schnuerera sp. xch1 TaxID=2874283 RepID=UPI001CBC4B12|nr:MutS family DNA mismatch repair protein [Schnuerera sp. xch1]MBZ2175561.1 DNA mismatch repair protein [Schnuerera sp. xch1]
METIKRKYERRKKSYNKLLEKQKKGERQISNLRLLIFIVGISVAVYAYLTHRFIILALSLVVFVTTFIYLVISHKKLKKRIKYTALLRDINIKSLKRLKGEWNTFEDDGEDFKDDNHNYLVDLYIFGKNSLFQYINAVNTFVGRQKLKQLLSEVVGNSDDIYQRQEAIEELGTMLNWRQRFLAEGMVISEKMHNPENLITWANERNEDFRKPWVITIFRILPCITIGFVLTGLVMNIIPWYWPIIALIVQYVLIRHKRIERFQMFNISENYNNDLRIYYNMLRLFEEQNFKSKHINKIKDGIKNENGLEAYKQIDSLSSIIDSISNRRNSLYFIFNILTLWDFQLIIDLEKWKYKSGHLLKNWLDALGKIEALSSLAIIRFENPDWVMPIIDDEETKLISKDIGHPLITKDRVHNDLTIDKNVKVMLITGSNMSGKSTLLRTAGINLVLAYAGAPVCAKYFRASIMKIYTCMNVTDDLSDNISSFYAELLRIKDIVKESESGEKIFFLLDEIFKGTNSLDRHTGAKVLINKLSHTNSIGMVSTHDLELCDLEEENDRIANYHFQEYYKHNKIYFDYKLRSGSSTTRNALYLMKMAGIDVEP